MIINPDCQGTWGHEQADRRGAGPCGDGGWETAPLPGLASPAPTPTATGQVEATSAPGPGAVSPPHGLSPSQRAGWLQHAGLGCRPPCQLQGAGRSLRRKGHVASGLGTRGAGDTHHRGEEENASAEP